MMDTTQATKIPFWMKMVFFLGDGLLMGVALTIVLEAPHPLPLPHAVLLVITVASGAVLVTVPFLLEYKASLQFAEIAELKSTSAQFEDLERLNQQIRQATSQWQTVQEHCTKAVVVATAIGEKMIAEGKAFTEFSQKADDTEKAHLRLEIDKFRRAEQDWLEVLVRISDHVYALYRAGQQSGQPALAEQLGLFQRAVRDSVRRVGLIPQEAQANDLYDERIHQPADAEQPVGPNSVVLDTVATGFTMQGKWIRRVVVATAVGGTNPDNPEASQIPSGGFSPTTDPSAGFNVSSSESPEQS